MLAGFALTYIIVFGAKALFEGVNEDRVFGALMFEALALTYTVGQWWVLRREIERSILWFPASIAGWLMVFVLAGYLGRQGLIVTTTTTGRFLLGLLAGLVLGIAQWLPLRKTFRWASIWILGSVAGWCLLSFAIGKSITNLFEMALMGAIPAILTGVVLVLLQAWSHGQGEAPAA